MKYCLTKHALIEDNGDLIATFNSCLSAGQAFKILDDLNNAKYVEQLEIDLEGERSDYKILEENVQDLKEKLRETKKDLEKLDNRLQGIITMLENDHGFKSMEEMAEEIIAICAEKL